ncbi:MAG: ACT domain-containing protein [Christensenellales bacterium]
MQHSDLNKCTEILKKFGNNQLRIIANTSLSKLTVEGAGMQRQSGVASKLFGALAEKNIGIYIITTSETKICFCVDSEKAIDAISVVSEAFSL